mgnify:CR=1 FL=1
MNGSDKFPFLCMDNFYEDPDSVRKLALSCKFHGNNGHWPGKRTEEISNIDRAFYEKFCSKLLGLFFSLDNPIQYNIETTFQKIEQMDPDPTSPNNVGWIHADGDQYILAGVIYLSPNCIPENGTSIFKVRNPKTITHSDSKLDYYLKGENNNHEKELLGHNSSFTESIRFNSVYNRLIVFPADAYHGVNSFNNPSGEPRLTQVFFMRKCETKELPPIQRSRNI